MDFVLEQKEKSKIVTSILDSIISDVLNYCQVDPLSELVNRNKLNSILLGNGNRIRVLCYNLMADTLNAPNMEDSKKFEMKYIDWSYRSALIIKEIRNYDPDFVCLQEIDKHDNVIADAFKETYDTFFKSRTNDKNDGCLTLIRKDKYEIVERHFIEYFLSPHDLLLNRDNVLTIVVVRAKNPSGGLFFVANTHILFSDGRGDIKTAQIHLATRALYSLAMSSRFKNANVHMLYMGDFNLIPNSGIYDLISKGRFDFREQKSNYLSGQKLGALRLIPNFKSLGDFLSMNINKYRFNMSNCETKRDVLYAWINHLKNIELLILEPKNSDPVKIEFALKNIMPLDPDNEQTYILNNPIFLLSAYSSFQNYYYQLKNKQFQSEFFLPKYSTYEPFFTCKTVGALMSVDYIWFFSVKHTTNTQLQVKSVFSLPQSKQLKKVFVFPNRIYPSDHFSLIVDFELI